MRLRVLFWRVLRRVRARGMWSQMTRTPARSVRIPDHVWRAAQERAASEGTTVTAVILRALTSYGQGPITVDSIAENRAALRMATDDTWGIDTPKC